MPVITITASDLIGSAIASGRETSDRIIKLADLNVTPLVPGETVDERRHRIAKLGKQLAETFLALDTIMETISDSMQTLGDVTAGPIRKTAPVGGDQGGN